MGLVNRLMSYDFTNFKFGNKDPQGRYIADVMEDVPRGGKNHSDLKKKIDKELGFKEYQRGISYPTLIKYLALALEDMERNTK